MEISSSVSFGKTLVAQCDLRRQNHRKVPCNIFQLNFPEDKDYFFKLENSKPWEKAWFMWDMDEEFNSDVTGERTYVIESKGGRCLGFASVLEDDELPGEEELVYLETCPKYQITNEKRTIKYIGETLIAFITGLAKGKDIKTIEIKAYTSNGERFYKKKCNFEQRNDEKQTLFLRRENFENVINKNKAHTHSEIRYLV